jgi:hypothetical protein
MYKLDVNIDNTIKVRYHYIIKLLLIQIFSFLFWMTFVNVIDNLFLISIHHNSNCFRFNHKTTLDIFESFIILKNKFRVH